MKKALLFAAVFLAVFLILPALVLPALSAVLGGAVGIVEFAVTVVGAGALGIWAAKRATIKGK